MLNEQGDVTITWTEDEDAAVEATIAAKMAEGVVFFIIEDRAFPPQLRLVKEGGIGDIHEKRALLVKDKHFQALLGSRKGDVVKTPPAPAKSVRKAKTPKEASTAQTVGVRRLVGG